MYICNVCKTPTPRENYCETCGWVTTTIIRDNRSIFGLPAREDIIWDKPYPLLSIIVLTFNALEYTKKCIASILKNTTVDYELIIVDNMSTDGTREWLKKIEKQKRDFRLKVILNSENKGVAGGRNVGLANMNTNQDSWRGDIKSNLWSGFAVFLDNDTEVFEGWDKEMLATFKNGSVMVVGHRGEEIASFRPLDFKNGKNDEHFHGIAETDVVPGYCFCFRKSLLKVIGNQYEGLGKFWHEDLEFCLRVKMAGYKVLVNTNIPMIHYWHKSVDASKTLSHEDMKKSVDGFQEKAIKVYQRMAESNVVKLYRSPHFNCNEAFCLIADRVADVFREEGLVVLRFDHVKSDEFSFNLCKTFEIEHNRRKYCLIHLENDRCPKSWIDQINQFDGVFCSSYQVYTSLCNSGVDSSKLINASPDGFDSHFYHFGVKPIKLKSDKFTFFASGASQPRKGTDLLIKAFCEQFSKEDNVRLVIKNYDYGKKEWVESLIKKFNKNGLEIKQIFEDWSPSKLASMYKAVSLNGCYVHPSRGEGFGITPLEAVACGCRVITTNWGGMTQTLKGLKTVDFIGYKMVESSFHNNAEERFYGEDENPMWAEPNIEELKERMAYAYHSKYDENEALNSSQKVTEEYDYKVTIGVMLGEMMSKSCEL